MLGVSLLILLGLPSGNSLCVKGGAPPTAPSKYVAACVTWLIKEAGPPIIFNGIAVTATSPPGGGAAAAAVPAAVRQALISK